MPLQLPRDALVSSLVEKLESARPLLLVGPRGSGKSHVLRGLSELASGPSLLVELEPLSTTPEMLARELRGLAGPMLERGSGRPLPAFASLVDALERRPEDSLLLLDDVTEIRTLSHYPNVEAPLASFLRALAASGRAIATSRFSFWLRREHPELELHPVPPVSPEEIAALGISESARLAAATAGLAHHVVRLAETMDARGLGLEDALRVELSPGGRVEAECRATLAELLLRARGYAACKAVLRILADEQGLKLTEVARRMDRTPGSTRDYLRWLEEVDLIHAVEKRFHFVDPLVRLWSRIHGRGVPADASHLHEEIAQYLDALPVAVLAETPEEPSSENGGYTLPPLPSGDLVEID